MTFSVFRAVAQSLVDTGVTVRHVSELVIDRRVYSGLFDCLLRKDILHQILCI